MSASSEESPNEIAEIVQQEAELPNEETKPTESDSVDDAVPEPVEQQESMSSDEPTDSNEQSEVEAEIESPTPEPEKVDTDAEVKVEEPVKEEEISADETPETEALAEADSDEPKDESGESVSDDDSEEEHDENEFDHVELDGASKKELLDWLKKIKAEDSIRKVDRLFKDLGAHFEEIIASEKSEALEVFLKQEGNEEGDFEFHGDEIDKEFQALYEEQRHKRSHYFHQLEKEREENLVKKSQLLDMIREIVDGEDQTSFNKVKKLQEEWRKVGPVPGSQNKTLWANYHALMDRFYDQRTIYFELKDLDRKKNLEAKIELCEKAEALDAENDLKNAVTQLNELHEEFKHIGPVPSEDQEPLWQRFKAASDKVYEHRKEFTELQKEEHKKNLEIKRGIAERAEELASFESDRIKEWNQKTKELQQLQKEWEACGGVPRDKAKEVNRAFWGNFKKFFGNKSKFFKTLDAQREDNLKKKQDLVAKAAELKESKDWEGTAKALKNLQNDWREIGPVPDKFRNSVYKEFKKNCDEFFERRRGQNAEQNKEFEVNLKTKLGILEQLEGLTLPVDLEQVYDLTEQFAEAGLVPRNAVGKTLDRYDKVSKQLLASGLTDSEISELRIHLDVCKLRNSPHGNQKINRKENTIKRKITGLENDVNNWKTNLDFFAKSKNADQLKSEFEQKILDAEKELGNLKAQLRHIHQ